MPYLGDSDSNLENYCHIWNQGPGICLIAKFGARKISKNFLYGYF